MIKSHDNLTLLECEIYTSCTEMEYIFHTKLYTFILTFKNQALLLKPFISVTCYLLESVGRFL